MGTQIIWKEFCNYISIFDGTTTSGITGNFHETITVMLPRRTENFRCLASIFILFSNLHNYTLRGRTRMFECASNKHSSSLYSYLLQKLPIIAAAAGASWHHISICINASLWVIGQHYHINSTVNWPRITVTDNGDVIFRLLFTYFTLNV